MYHKGCHASYINVKEKAPPADLAFKQFLEQIEANLNRGRVYDMSTLLAIYKNKPFEISSDEGLAKAYTSQNLKKRLQNHFGKKIVFFQQGSVTSPELVFSSTVDIKDVINTAFQCRESLENLNVEREIFAFNNADFPVNERLHFHDSLILRSYIRDIEGINSQPLDPVKRQSR